MEELHPKRGSGQLTAARCLPLVAYVESGVLFVHKIWKPQEKEPTIDSVHYIAFLGLSFVG